jgi:hypothetical protein
LNNFPEIIFDWEIKNGDRWSSILYHSPEFVCPYGEGEYVSIDKINLENEDLKRYSFDFYTYQNWNSGQPVGDLVPTYRKIDIWIEKIGSVLSFPVSYRWHAAHESNYRNLQEFYYKGKLVWERSMLWEGW